MSRAIFLGSFNPPHKGHYNAIQSVIDSGIMKKLNIEKIHIIPCWQNPNKNKFTVPFIKRYQMVYFMFGPLIREHLVCPDDIEDQLNPHPEYTYQLINWFDSGKDECINKNKEGFWWIITIETLRELLDGKWEKSEELLYDNNFIVLYESEGEKLALYEDYNMRNLCAEFVKINNPVNYHSTQLREKVKNGESIEEETCFWVNDYIKDMNLYKEEFLKIGQWYECYKEHGNIKIGDKFKFTEWPCYCVNENGTPYVLTPDTEYFKII